MYRKIVVASVAVACLSLLVPAKAADLAVKAAPAPYATPTGWYAITGASFPLGKIPVRCRKAGASIYAPRSASALIPDTACLAAPAIGSARFGGLTFQIQYATADVSNNNVTGMLVPSRFAGPGTLHGKFSATTVALDGYFDIAPLFAHGTPWKFRTLRWSRRAVLPCGCHGFRIGSAPAVVLA